MTYNTLDDLKAYKPSFLEEDDYNKIISLIEKEPECYGRGCFPAHVTGSAFLINKAGDKVLLNHHKSLNIWLQFGGHADGDSDILAVAKRELEEESGIKDFKHICFGETKIFDIDTHIIPANDLKNEPEHAHYDLRYLFQCQGREAFSISDESLELRWCSYDEAIVLMNLEDKGVRRMLDKWRSLEK